MKQYIKQRSSLLYCIGCLMILAILTGIDQLTKYFAIIFLKKQHIFSVIDGVLEFRYLENTGIAFGLFAGKLPIFILICIVFFAASLYFHIRVPKRQFYTPLILTTIVLSSGALGNFIDRIYHGYVIDFIYFKWINFPIFNVADIYVVISCIMLFALILFKYEDDDFKFLIYTHKEKKNG